MRVFENFNFKTGISKVYNIYMNKGKISSDTIIADEIRCMIFDESILTYGSKLPSDDELCLKFGCSKNTLIQSLTTLKNENVLIQKSDGWYVVDKPRLRKYINRFESFSTYLESFNFSSSKQMVNSTKLTVDSNIANLTHFPLGEEVYYFERLRIIDNEPICIERDYISKTICPGLDKFDIINNSLYSVLKKEYNISVDRGIEQIKVIEANEEEAILLNIECNTPLIKQYGYTFSDEGDEIEYTECIMRIERFEFLK